MPAGRSSGAARSFCGLVLVRKRLADGSYGWPKIPAFRAGRRARTARTKQERGPLAPTPALVLRALRARKTPPPRRAPLRYPAPPWPAGIRRPYGGRPGAQNGWGGHGGRRRLAAVGRPAGPPHGQPNKRVGPGAKGPGPPSFRALRAPPPPPSGRYDLHQGQKRQQNAQPYGRPNPAPPHWSHDGMRSAPVKELYRGRADEARGDEGSGGTARFAAGGDPKIPSPAIGRISPCA